MSIELDAFHSFNAGLIVFLTGWRVNSRVGFLRRYSIPEPVTGGLLASLLCAAIYVVFGQECAFDLSARDWLMLYFFTSIGLGANFKKLLAGGKSLAMLLAIAVVFLAMQNLAGVSVASLLGMERAVGLIAGSVSLVGGHGTAIAWAPQFAANHGVPNAMELGAACATFGLILASLMGGPVANYFVKKHNLKSTEDDALDIGSRRDGNGAGSINYIEFLRSLLVLHVAIALGLGLDEALEEMGAMLPNFVPCLIMGILLANTIPFLLKKYPWPAGSQSMALIAEVALGVFLAMSLMSLQLWQLVDLAGPMLALLAAQFALALAFTMLVVFPLMGRDYEAVVICSGFGGISMGSTPTAIANMTAVTESYGPAHKAFIVVPLVCSFFIDIANALMINLFL